MRVTKSRLVLVLHLIGWVDGVSLFFKPITEYSKAKPKQFWITVLSTLNWKSLPFSFSIELEPRSGGSESRSLRSLWSLRSSSEEERRKKTSGTKVENPGSFDNYKTLVSNSRKFLLKHSCLLCCSSQVTSVALELGSRESRCAVLVWSGWGGETAIVNNYFVNYGLKSASKEDQIDWDDLKIVSKIKWVCKIYELKKINTFLVSINLSIRRIFPRSLLLFVFTW